MCQGGGTHTDTAPKRTRAGTNTYRRKHTTRQHNTQHTPRHATYTHTHSRRQQQNNTTQHNTHTPEHTPRHTHTHTRTHTHRTTHHTHTHIPNHRTSPHQPEHTVIPGTRPTKECWDQRTSPVHTDNMIGLLEFSYFGFPYINFLTPRSLILDATMEG